jgi:aminoglycoside 6'-N-acetyltransferase I
MSLGTIRIVDLQPDDETAIQQIAELMVEAFREHWPEAWPDLESARQEVRESFERDRISRVALDNSGTVLGWIGGIRQYEGHVWELHPLVVKPQARLPRPGEWPGAGDGPGSPS